MWQYGGGFDGYTQVAENGLHIKGKMNDGEPPPLTCIPFPAYHVDKGLTPLNNIFCSILHRDLEFTQILGQSLPRVQNLRTTQNINKTGGYSHDSTIINQLLKQL